MPQLAMQDLKEIPTQPVDDDATEEDINDEALSALFGELIEWGWYEE